jgi:hypothetical protein
VVLIPDRTRTKNDPLASVPITVLALDEYGYPVKGAEVELAVVDGGGKLPAAKVTTDASGTALVAYAPSRLTGLARIRATVKGPGTEEDVHTIAILQSPDGVAPQTASLPASGTEQDSRTGRNVERAPRRDADRTIGPRAWNAARFRRILRSGSKRSGARAGSTYGSSASARSGSPSSTTRGSS